MTKVSVAEPCARQGLEVGTAAKPPVSVAGLGKLGACMAAAFAQKGFSTVGVDVNDRTIELLSQKRAPVFEPGLSELLRSAGDRLFITKDYGQAVANTEATFVVVPTPSQNGGAFSLKHVLVAARSIGQALRGKAKPHLVVICSTVLPGSTEFAVRPMLEQESGKRCGVDFWLCYSPEFIAIGSVIRDFLHPDFALIGETSPEAGERLAAIYSSLFDNNPPICRMSAVNAELTKIAVNTYVTTKITFANLLAEICERLPGGDVDVVTSALGLDSRIGRKYLRGALGYGGTCFPRDNIAFSYLLERMGVPTDLPRTVDQFNQRIVQRIATLAKKSLNHPHGRVGILGLSYKTSTSVVEESQGVEIARSLASDGVEVMVYDPAAMEEARKVLGDSVTFARSIEQCLAQTDVLIVATPWPEFAAIALQRRNPSAKPIIIDAWRITRSPSVKNTSGYIGIGLSGADADNEISLANLVRQIVDQDE